MLGDFWAFIHENGCPGGCSAVLEHSSTKTGVLVDARPFLGIHPRKRASWWMLGEFWAFIHGNGYPWWMLGYFWASIHENG